MAIYYNGGSSGSWTAAGSGDVLLTYKMLDGCQSLASNPPSPITDNLLLSYTNLWNKAISSDSGDFRTTKFHGTSGLYSTNQLVWAQDAEWRNNNEPAEVTGSISIPEPGGISGYTNGTGIAITIIFFEDQNDVDDGSIGGIMAHKHTEYNPNNTNHRNDFWGKIEYFVKYGSFSTMGTTNANSYTSLCYSYSGKKINNSIYNSGRYPQLMAFNGTFFSPDDKAMYFTNGGYNWSNGGYTHYFKWGNNDYGHDSESEPVSAWVWGRGSMYHVGCIIVLHSSKSNNYPTLPNGNNPVFALYSKSTVWSQAAIKNQCKRLSGYSASGGTLSYPDLSFEFKSYGGYTNTSSYGGLGEYYISYDYGYQNYQSLTRTRDGQMYAMVIPRIDLNKHYALCWNVCAN